MQPTSTALMSGRSNIVPFHMLIGSTSILPTGANVDNIKHTFLLNPVNL